MVIYECVTGWRPFHSENFEDSNKYSTHVSKKKKEDIREDTDGGMNTNMFITIVGKYSKDYCLTVNWV